MHAHEVAALAERATAGEWRKRGDDSFGFFVERPRQPKEAFGQQILADDDYPTKEGDCDFIAAARTHWPAHAQQLCDLQRENDRLRQFVSRQTEEIQSLHDMADAVERLREIGRATGCDHVDSSDGRSQLVNCVEQVIAKAESERDDAIGKLTAYKIRFGELTE
jgi:hypothetical protein